jgi:hypothetical protein
VGRPERRCDLLDEDMAVVEDPAAGAGVQLRAQLAQEGSSVVELLVAGASSYVLKGLPPRDLADRLRESMAAHTRLAVAAC